MNGVNKGRMAIATASAAFLFAACQSVASQQVQTVAAPASQHKNLKVLPAAIPKENLMRVMKNFTGALGVNCTHCHEGTKENMDFASDGKSEKDVARAMMLMVRRINEKDFVATSLKEIKVTCFTCHRGALKPLTASQPSDSAS